MNILVFNSGSSSLKFLVRDMPAEAVLSRGLIDAIGRGEKTARLVFEDDRGRMVDREVDCPDHRTAVRLALEVLGSDLTVDAVGHRVVHGGSAYTAPTLIDDEVLGRLRGLIDLAPLHQPINLDCLEVCRGALPGRPQAAVFDTSWHASMPPRSFRYPVPEDWYTNHGLRRYGFHGSSHQYVTLATAALLDRPLTELKLITLHLGHGCSAAAFDQGRVLDTSMGFTPLEGLMMGTRAGDFDPAAVDYLAAKTGMSWSQAVEALNQKSGLLGVSGVSSDLRAVLAARDGGDPRAGLAVEMFVHRLRKSVGAYFFALGGADGIVFTGGIGQNSPEIRGRTLADLEACGIRLDPALNETMVGGRSGPISAKDSAVKVMVIQTDEELMIARETYALVGRS
jgi:acetate kinase